MDLKLRSYIVTTETGESVTTGAPRRPMSHRVDAAYFRSENGFTNFKDEDHKVVFSVRDDLLATVERLPDPDDFSELLRRMVREADEKGLAQGGWRKREELPDGRTCETGYDFTVAAVSSSEVSA